MFKGITQTPKKLNGGSSKTLGNCQGVPPSLPEAVIPSDGGSPHQGEREEQPEAVRDALRSTLVDGCPHLRDVEDSHDEERVKGDGDGHPAGERQ